MEYLLLRLHHLRRREIHLYRDCNKKVRMMPKEQGLYKEKMLRCALYSVQLLYLRVIISTNLIGKIVHIKLVYMYSAASHEDQRPPK